MVTKKNYEYEASAENGGVRMMTRKNYKYVPKTDDPEVRMATRKNYQYESKKQVREETLPPINVHYQKKVHKDVFIKLIF